MAKKRRPSLDPAQLGFTFDVPSPARDEASLAGLDRVVASGIAEALKSDGRSRFEIAGKVSELLSEDVSKLMLDAYASEARENHNVPAHRALAIIAVTERIDVLDAWLRRIGVAALFGEELQTAQLGHIDRQIAELQSKKKLIQKSAKPFQRHAL